MALKVRSGILLALLASLCQNANAGGCEIRAPIISGDESPQIGLIFVPGAKIPGSAYLPLLEAVQEHYPGSLWVGATSEWLSEMPNPIEIGGQVTTCLDKAAEAGYSTETIFFGGHSLGGIVLESYISGHADIANGIALIGTWLPDLLGEKLMYVNLILTILYLLHYLGEIMSIQCQS